MCKQLPILQCVDNHTKAMNYLVLALTAYKATAKVMFDMLINVTIVCQVFKPMLKLQGYKKLKQSHQAIFTLFSSAANIFLIQTLGEFHELKSNMLENEESTIGNTKGDSSEEKTCKIISSLTRKQA